MASTSSVHTSFPILPQRRTAAADVSCCTILPEEILHAIFYILFRDQSTQPTSGVLDRSWKFLELRLVCTEFRRIAGAVVQWQWNQMRRYPSGSFQIPLRMAEIEKKFPAARDAFFPNKEGDALLAIFGFGQLACQARRRAVERGLSLTSGELPFLAHLLENQIEQEVLEKLKEALGKEYPEKAFPRNPEEMRAWCCSPLNRELLAEAKNLTLSYADILDLPLGIQKVLGRKKEIEARSLTILYSEINLQYPLVGLPLQAEEVTEWLSLKENSEKLREVTKLDLSGLQLESLPTEIGYFKWLSELDLQENLLTILPEEIGELEQLVDLYLDQNRLSSLPTKIGNLTSLQGLYLFQNQLKTLPPEIGELKALARLCVGENQLTSLPKEVGSLACLEHLDIEQNQLLAFPSELRRLNEIYFEGNPLAHLPEEGINSTNS